MRIKRFIENDPIRRVSFPWPSLGDRRAHLVEELRPREGELLKAGRGGRYGRVQPWAADDDKLLSESRRHTAIIPWKGLRVLFENEELYGSLHKS